MASVQNCYTATLCSKSIQTKDFKVLKDPIVLFFSFLKCVKLGNKPINKL